MRILTVHNKYLFRGGEDESREAEDRLLSANGHEIRQVVFANDSIGRSNLFQIGCHASWSQTTYDRVARELAAWKPDVLDVHNFFPLASPSVHYAAHRMGVPVIQTLHNYRLLCPGANFLRDGRVCEDCTSHMVAWPGVVHRCYRGSALQTGAVALMISVHRLLRTWQRCVTVFVVLSEFAKRKFVENGFSGSKIVVKPNFVEDPGETGVGGQEFVFAGRLSREKGILVLLAAMERTGPEVRVNIIGEGPLEAEVRAAAARNPRVRFFGRLGHCEVLSQMAAAKCVVVPSICYETFGRAAAEAYSVGSPVIASRIGALEEMVENGRTGLHCEPGDPADLARAMIWVTQNQPAVARMRMEARLEYLEKYTAERNYGLLVSIYERAIAGNSPRRKSGAASLPH
ncbi:MAG: glycosyltransferase family 4 protein [Bryobacteraceae bacterium]|jgi:glycosyltransferase involved in cell wall biosynthesis